MNNYFEFKVQYDKTLGSGLIKKVTEPYLVDALSFTEAEARAVEELKPFISGEFAIAGIRRMHLFEIFFDETGDRFFRAKVKFITIDEKTGTEKQTAVSMLVKADSIDSAIVNLRKGMEGTLADWYLFSITETPIMDVFLYKAVTEGEDCVVLQ